MLSPTPSDSAPSSAQSAESRPQEGTAHAGHDGSRSTQLLFVNKDARSLFRPNSRTKSKEIFSHVQRVAANSQHRQKAPRNIPNAKARPIVPIPKTKLKTSQENVDTESNREEDQVAIVNPPLCSANFNQGDNFDPFNATSVHINREIHNILTYFMSVCTRSIFKFDVDARPAHKHHFTNYFDQMVRQCLEDELHMYTVLAVASGRMTNRAHSLYSTVSPTIAQHFMCKAVECLRQTFASEKDCLRDKYIIVTLICVTSFEWYLADYEAARTHLRAISIPFATLDKSCDYDRWIMSMASHPDIYMAIETLSPPVLPAKSPGPYPRPLPTPTLGKRLRELYDNTYFGPAMASVMNDLLPCIQVWHTLTPSALLSDVVWTGEQLHFILHTLLDMGPDTGLTDEEECCRIALVIILTYPVTMTFKRSGMLNASRLQKALRKVQPRPRDLAEQELLLWIMITGLFAAGETPEAESLTEQVVQLALAMKVNTYTKLLGLMERFIWIEKLQEPFLHQLWTKITIATEWRDQRYGSSTDLVKQFDPDEVAIVSAQISGIVAMSYSDSFQTGK